MKVSEILSEASGAYYKPHYDNEKGYQKGAVKDWLDKMGATSADVAAAMARVKNSAEFKALAQVGMKYVAKPAAEKNGTFGFEVERPSWHISKDANGKDTVWGKIGSTRKTAYNIHANGLIRAASDRGWGASGQYTTPLKSPKPRMKAGDPVGSLEMMYKAAMVELAVKWKKQLAQFDAMKAKAEKLQKANA